MTSQYFNTFKNIQTEEQFWKWTENKLGLWIFDNNTITDKNGIININYLNSWNKK